MLLLKKIKLIKEKNCLRIKKKFEDYIIKTFDCVSSLNLKNLFIDIFSFLCLYNLKI